MAWADVDAVLRPLGFKKEKARWYRRRNSSIDVVEIQVSKGGDSVTANIGALDSEIFRMCWGQDPAGVIQASHCTVEARLGTLATGRDTWWPLGSSEFVPAIAIHAQLFLEQVHAPGGLEDVLASSLERRGLRGDPSRVIYLALLRNRRGDRSGACQLLADLRSRTSDAWKSRVSTVAAAIGCGD